ncbi:MAG: hypothetical protein Q9211_001438 [Gyalolechia sp. 1 TL-2023]
MSSPPIDTVGNLQFTVFGDKRWKRRVGTTEWKILDDLPPTAAIASSPMELKLVRQEQTAGEPYHWSLFLAPEGKPGDVFQVKGDAVGMHYVHAEFDILRSLSYTDSYIIALPTEDQALRVRYWATHEPPPRAPNQAAVTENCQGWTVRVIRRLVEEGIVQQKWLNTAVSLQEPVR